jgi:deoxycytidine triphosphate deaminase
VIETGASTRCGLLSDREIRRMCVQYKLMTDFDPAKLRGAAYDIRIANDGLVTPDGKKYPPRSLGGTATLNDTLLLAPGDVAELSSREQFNMPADVAGNIALRTSYAQRGLLLLSGLLIEPGYGPTRDDDDKLVSDGRLHLFVANIGSDTIPLRPGEDSIAAVQFFRTVGGIDENRRVQVPTVAHWDRQRPERRLGFIAELKSLRQEHEALATDVHRTRESTMNVIILGYFLLAATILGLTLNNLLSVGSNPSLVNRIARAVPDSVSGKALLAAVFIAVAWTVRSIVLLIHIERRPPPAADSTRDDRFFDHEARDSLVTWRRRGRLALGFAAGLAAATIVVLAVDLRFSAEPFVWIASAGCIGIVVFYVDALIAKPIDAKRIQARADRLNVRDD